MATSNLRQIFDKSTRAFNAHDIDAFVDLMTDEVSTRPPGMEELRGKAAVKAYYRGWLDAFPDARVEIEAAHVLGDVVVEEGYFTGTHQAPLRTPGGDLPPTGRSVRVEYMQVLRFRGDKISSTHLSFDRMEMLEQLGLAPSPEQEPASAWRGQTGSEQPPARH